jgi:hypothetical protein
MIKLMKGLLTSLRLQPATFAFRPSAFAKQRRIVAALDAPQPEVGMVKRLQARTTTELDAFLSAILDRAFKGEL